MGTVLLSDAREITFKDKKMLFSVLSASLVVLAAGSALPEERISCSFPPGTCMAWTWSSVSGCKCTKVYHQSLLEWPFNHSHTYEMISYRIFSMYQKIQRLYI